jgi:hypothetical protein
MQPCKHPNHFEAHVEHHSDEDLFELLGRQQVRDLGSDNGERDAAPGQENPLKPVEISC